MVDARIYCGRERFTTNHANSVIATSPKTATAIVSCVLRRDCASRSSTADKSMRAGPSMCGCSGVGASPAPGILGNADSGMCDDAFADGPVLAAAAAGVTLGIASSFLLPGVSEIVARNSFAVAGGSIEVGDSSAFGGRVGSGCERFSCCQRARFGSAFADPPAVGGGNTVTGLKPAGGCAAAGCPATGIAGGIAGCGGIGDMAAGAANSGGYSVAGCGAEGASGAGGYAAPYAGAPYCGAV